MGKVNTSEFTCDLCQTVLPRSEHWPKASPVENRVDVQIRIPYPDDPEKTLEYRATEFCAQCKDNFAKCLDLFVTARGIELGIRVVK